MGLECGLRLPGFHCTHFQVGVGGGICTPSSTGPFLAEGLVSPVKKEPTFWNFLHASNCNGHLLNWGTLGLNFFLFLFFTTYGPQNINPRLGFSRLGKVSCLKAKLRLPLMVSWFFCFLIQIYIKVQRTMNMVHCATSVVICTWPSVSILAHPRLAPELFWSIF